MNTLTRNVAKEDITHPRQLPRVKGYMQRTSEPIADARTPHFGTNNRKVETCNALERQSQVGREIVLSWGVSWEIGGRFIFFVVLCGLRIGMLVLMFLWRCGEGDRCGGCEDGQLVFDFGLSRQWD